MCACSCAVGRHAHKSAHTHTHAHRHALLRWAAWRCVLRCARGPRNSRHRYHCRGYTRIDGCASSCRSWRLAPPNLRPILHQRADSGAMRTHFRVFARVCRMIVRPERILPILIRFPAVLSRVHRIFFTTAHRQTATQHPEPPNLSFPSYISPSQVARSCDFTIVSNDV